MTAIKTMTVNVDTILRVDGTHCPMWKIRALGFAAKLLRVPVEFDALRASLRATPPETTTQETTDG